MEMVTEIISKLKDVCNKLIAVIVILSLLLIITNVSWLHAYRETVREYGIKSGNNNSHIEVVETTTDKPVVVRTRGKKHDTI